MLLDKTSSDGIVWVERYVAVVAENIRRKRGTMTQQELADKANVSRTVVQRAESGKSIEFDNLLRIAHALGVEPGDLYLTADEHRAFTAKVNRLVDALYEALEGKKKG